MCIKNMLFILLILSSTIFPKVSKLEAIFFMGAGIISTYCYYQWANKVEQQADGTVTIPNSFFLVLDELDKIAAVQNADDDTQNKPVIVHNKQKQWMNCKGAYYSAGQVFVKIETDSEKKSAEKNPKIID